MLPFSRARFSKLLIDCDEASESEVAIADLSRKADLCPGS